MKDEEEFSQEQIALEAARDRILGVAIQHYLYYRREGTHLHCALCVAVQNFESKIEPGICRCTAISTSRQNPNNR